MRTTVSVTPSHRDRLNDLKRQWRLRSVDQVLDRLLEGPATGARPLYERNRQAVEAALKKHGISRLVAFGSRARGDAGFDSDLDVLVRMPDGTDLFDLIHLQDDLSAAFGVPVDVATEGGINDRLRALIQKEGIVLVP